MSRFDPEVVAAREAKTRAIISNDGGVWLTDDTFIPKDELPVPDEERKVYEVRVIVESYGSEEDVRRTVIDQLGYTGLMPKAVRVTLDEEKTAALD